ncbi:MAG: choice-of-anchor Q domain-containing protein, partial [Chitinophagaceae bacterium]
LMGGLSSFYKMNIDGISGTEINNVEIAANDSVYGFVTVSINPTLSTLPFIVKDSIAISYNGNRRFLQLDAFGKNAHFLRNRVIQNDTTFSNQLPIVILGSLTVAETKTLTLQKGTKIYVNANAPIIVRGTLVANGEVYDSTKIHFRGDRLDEPYRNYPGAWPGIYFTATSINNRLQHCVIQNSYQGVILENLASNNNPKLRLQECIFNNIYDVAIGASNSSITASNCLISNCGYNLFFVSGGTYQFYNSTIVSYNNNYVEHKNPVATVSNTNGNNISNPLTCLFENCILYGEGGLVDNELVLGRNTNTNFSLTLNHVAYKLKNDLPITGVFQNNTLKNVNPIFDSINVNNRFFNFRLKQGSPLIDKGTNSSLSVDLDGKNRTVNNLTDIGCYEKQ